MNTLPIPVFTKYQSDLKNQISFVQQSYSKQSNKLLKQIFDINRALLASNDQFIDVATDISTPLKFSMSLTDYCLDAMQRSILTLDALHRSHIANLNHSREGSPPLLTYDFEIILDGADLPQPTNYMLLMILPKQHQTIDTEKRPYVIIDPRAGHGAGIGGFKEDSQVGVALDKNHPVYFIAFRQAPEPNQTLYDVCESETTFIKEIERRHPNSQKPIIVGNCQGGWAAAIMASLHPEFTGPLVLNGAPMSFWAGNIGQNPLRYSAGVKGGLPLTLGACDIGNGIFDGANLVLNFETLNPSRNWLKKFYELYADIDSEKTVDRFVKFETWWNSFYLMNEAEIRWIVENLFIGNYLSQNKAKFNNSKPINLKDIKSPIICFASKGDNITPIPQALNWILDTYNDEFDIVKNGQRIIYMVHENVGHLGIFVSSKVANNEHKGMLSLLETIEALLPGLYELKVCNGDMAHDVMSATLIPSSFDDLSSLTGDRSDEKAFASVARASETTTALYETYLRPIIKLACVPYPSEIIRNYHPLRIRSQFLNKIFPSNVKTDENLWDNFIRFIKNNRHIARQNSVFHTCEISSIDFIEQLIDFYRDLNEALTELSFLYIWTSPISIQFGEANNDFEEKKQPTTLYDPFIKEAISNIDHGGYAAGILRVGIALVDEYGAFHAGQLERLITAVETMEPFKSMEKDSVKALATQQLIIVRFHSTKGLSQLDTLFKNDHQKTIAKNFLKFILFGNTNKPNLEMQKIYEKYKKKLVFETA